MHTSLYPSASQTRDDLLLGFLAHHQKMATQQGGSVSGADDWAGVMVLSVGGQPVNSAASRSRPGQSLAPPNSA